MFLYCFQRLLALHHGSGEMLRWIARLQPSRSRVQEAWGDTHVPITDLNNLEARAYVTSLQEEQQSTVNAEEALARANERLKKQYSMTIRITANLIALMFVSLAELAQRQVLSSPVASLNHYLEV